VAIDEGSQADRVTTPITRAAVTARCPLQRHAALLAALSQPLVGRHSK